MIPVIRGGQQRHSGLSPSSTSFQASVGIGMGARLEKGVGSVEKLVQVCCAAVCYVGSCLVLARPRWEF